MPLRASDIRHVEDLESIEIAKIGRRVETNPLFPQKTSVHFVQILDRRSIRLRIWERGGGIPLGSGSCACAAAVSGMRRGLLDASVGVHCDGGRFEVVWDGSNGVFLRGSVEFGYYGTWL
ncbi:diaminopimelate epimerase [Pantoea dispersa]|uniref:hypothetical protein n=1 Tax=Pantoea dispersa TaxID=59814 RepID=UPI001CA78222|nr:hypothetical protein [Pantoea dispersa]QZY97669.1 hypothetical protein K7X52_23285 [Pantoea dispersa]